MKGCHEQGEANYGWADFRDNHLVPEMAEIRNTKYQLCTGIRERRAGHLLPRRRR